MQRALIVSSSGIENKWFLSLKQSPQQGFRWDLRVLFQLYLPRATTFRQEMRQLAIAAGKSDQPMLLRDVAQSDQQKQYRL